MHCILRSPAAAVAVCSGHFAVAKRPRITLLVVDIGTLSVRIDSLKDSAEAIRIGIYLAVVFGKASTLISQRKPLVMNLPTSFSWKDIYPSRFTSAFRPFCSANQVRNKQCFSKTCLIPFKKTTQNNEDNFFNAF